MRKHFQGFHSIGLNILIQKFGDHDDGDDNNGFIPSHYDVLADVARKKEKIKRATKAKRLNITQK